MGTETRYRERMKTRGIIAIASASALVIVGGFVGVVTASALSQVVPTPVATVEPVVGPKITPTPTPTPTVTPTPEPVVEAPPAPVVEEPAPVAEEPVAEEPAPEVVEPESPSSVECGPGETPSAYDANNNVTACGPDCSQIIVADDGSETCIPNALPERGYSPYEPA